MQDRTYDEQTDIEPGNNLLPPGTPLLLDWKDLRPIVRFSRATLHREVNAGRFPKPINIAAQKTAWVRPEIERWMANRIAVRDGVAG